MKYEYFISWKTSSSRIGNSFWKRNKKIDSRKDIEEIEKYLEKEYNEEVIMNNFILLKKGD